MMNKLVRLFEPKINKKSWSWYHVPQKGSVYLRQRVVLTWNPRAAKLFPKLNIKRCTVTVPDVEIRDVGALTYIEFAEESLPSLLVITESRQGSSGEQYGTAMPVCRSPLFPGMAEWDTVFFALCPGQEKGAGSGPGSEA